MGLLCSAAVETFFTRDLEPGNVKIRVTQRHVACACVHDSMTKTHLVSVLLRKVIRVCTFERWLEGNLHFITLMFQNTRIGEKHNYCSFISANIMWRHDVPEFRGYKRTTSTRACNWKMEDGIHMEKSVLQGLTIHDRDCCTMWVTLAQKVGHLSSLTSATTPGRNTVLYLHNVWTVSGLVPFKNLFNLCSNRF